ncbi:MAG: hypothetical protein ABFD07_18490 [Methanobacterium sp.]
MNSEIQTRNPGISKIDDADNGCLTIPYALIEYHSRTLYNTYFLLENQMVGLDASSEEYAELESITQRVFNAWVTLGFRNEGGE